MDKKTSVKSRLKMAVRNSIERAADTPITSRPSEVQNSLSAAVSDDMYSQSLQQTRKLREKNMTPQRNANLVPFIVLSPGLTLRQKPYPELVPFNVDAMAAHLARSFIYGAFPVLESTVTKGAGAAAEPEIVMPAGYIGLEAEIPGVILQFARTAEVPNSPIAGTLTANYGNNKDLATSTVSPLSYSQAFTFQMGDGRLDAWAVILFARIVNGSWIPQNGRLRLASSITHGKINQYDTGVPAAAKYLDVETIKFSIAAGGAATGLATTMSALTPVTGDGKRYLDEYYKAAGWE